MIYYRTDVFDKINNNRIVDSFKQISQTGNTEVSSAGIPKVGPQTIWVHYYNNYIT